MHGAAVPPRSCCCSCCRMQTLCLFPRTKLLHRLPLIFPAWSAARSSMISCGAQLRRHKYPSLELRPRALATRRVGAFFHRILTAPRGRIMFLVTETNNPINNFFLIIYRTQHINNKHISNLSNLQVTFTPPSSQRRPRQTDWPSTR